MTANEDKLNTFTTRVRQMILQYKDLKKENNELYAMVDERDKKIKDLQEKLSQKMAKMLEVTDTDVEGAQKRIAKLIREVNKCITLLSEK